VVSRTLLVVDDHAAFREQARQMLQGEVFEVIGEAATAGEALALAGLLRPEVVVLDVGLPDGDGFELAAMLVRRAPAPAVVLVSSRDWGRGSRRVRNSGARGFIPKDELTPAAVEELILT
jgi:DNA-binding NarL/FixJ family response regulator